MKTKRNTRLILLLILFIGINACEKDEGKIEETENACSGQTNLTYGGQTYEIVEIGNQCWMAENLNSESNNSWWYDNSSSYGDVYGRLYTWEAALTACPSGWHLPSDDEWKQMEMAQGMSQYEVDQTAWRGTDEGEKLKSTSGWNNNGNGTNSSGFNAPTVTGFLVRTESLATGATGGRVQSTQVRWHGIVP